MSILKTKDIKAVLTAVNSTGNFAGEKYPIGNQVLTKILKNLEHERKITFDVYHSQWRLGK